jgi:hypothetical protein
MIGNFLAYMPDVLGTLDGLWGRHNNGPMHRFTFTATSAGMGMRVEKLLKTRGVRIWGRAIHPNDGRSFLVKETQAEWAEYILCSGGIPLTCRLLNPENAKAATRTAPPKPWGKGVGPKTIMDYIAKWMGV